MELNMYFVDWNKVVALANIGDLKTGFADALNNDAGWLEDAEFPVGSHILYVAAAEAWETIRGADEVSVQVDRNAREFLDHLITHENYAMELPDEIPDLLIAISPETATRLTRIATEFDISLYRKAYLTRCDSFTKEDFAQCAEDGTVDAGFEEGFLPYVTEWVDVVRSAAESGRGLLVELC